MGKLVYSMNVSLDGYVTDRAGEFASWAQPDEQVLAAITEATSTVSTYLLGRRMYEMMAVWETNPEIINQSPQSTQFARIWQAADKIVYSSTLEAVRTSRTQLRSRFDPGEVAQIKADAEGDDLRYFPGVKAGTQLGPRGSSADQGRRGRRCHRRGPHAGSRGAPTQIGRPHRRALVPSGCRQRAALPTESAARLGAAR